MQDKDEFLPQLDAEKELLNSLFEDKSRVPYSSLYASSAVPSQMPVLGTIEADVSGKYGRWIDEPFRAYKLALLAAKHQNIRTILDVGAGNLLASSFFAAKGKIVDICEFESSPYLTQAALSNSNIRSCYFGNFLDVVFPSQYDLVWASHVLEHQLDINFFLQKMIELVADGGFLAIAVPPRKPFIVSGHVNLFNPGLLVYRLILAGLDCSNAKLFQYDGNICVIVQKSLAFLPRLKYDIGDLALLSPFFPFDASEGFNGDFMNSNLSQDELDLVYSVI